MFRQFSSVLMICLMSLCHDASANWEPRKLLDGSGELREIGKASEFEYTVILIHGVGCPIVQKSLPRYRDLASRFGSSRFEFLLLNPVLHDSLVDIQVESSEFDLDIPVLKDRSQQVAMELGVKRTAEVYVVRNETGSILYSGPIDNRFGYGVRRQTRAENYLETTLINLLADERFEPLRIEASGCLVKFEEAASPDYVADVVPILKQHCVSCHRQGGVAPWAMDSFEKVRGFSPMIREVLETKRMPPFFYDDRFEDIGNSKLLSVSDERTILEWISAGAQRGDLTINDPLVSIISSETSWSLGEPDYVVTLPETEIPADANLDYVYPEVAIDIPPSSIVKAMEVIPGDARALHHAIIGLRNKEAVFGKDNQSVIYDQHLVTYVPGQKFEVYPADTGIRIEGSHKLVAQMHYTTYGKSSVDQTKIGFFFADKKPRHALLHHAIIDPWIFVPPHKKSHNETAYFELDADGVLFGVFPHAHYRGAKARFDIFDSDNEELRTVLSLPEYDFDWQQYYMFDDPIELSAGDQIRLTITYDNSATNFGNPNPNRAARWGYQSWQEMLYGGVLFRYEDRGVTRDYSKVQAQTIMGYMDRDMDSELSYEELSPILRNKIDGLETQLDSYSLKNLMEVLEVVRGSTYELY